MIFRTESAPLGARKKTRLVYVRTSRAPGDITILMCRGTQTLRCNVQG